jgi:4-hydroxy-tetrahydrodipicolinate reductase
MLKILLHGCCGRMGAALAQIAADHSVEICAGVDPRAEASGFAFPVFSRVGDCAITCDVAIDFSNGRAVPTLLNYCVSRGLPAVICTTGLDGEAESLLNDAASRIPVLRGANMSLGINLLASLLKKITATLADAGFDIEIIEKHHRNKLDSPSGTALFLADAANDSNSFTYIFDRSLRRAPRPANEIGISAVRGGTMTGEHEVIFAGADEVITFSHQALSRNIFATGALSAAKFIYGRPAGLYDMQDVFAAYLS